MKNVLHFGQIISDESPNVARELRQELKQINTPKGVTHMREKECHLNSLEDSSDGHTGQWSSVSIQLDSIVTVWSCEKRGS